MYSARHKVDQQLYTIKEVILEMVPEKKADIRESMEKMLKEVRLLASIQDVNILRYYNSWMEFVEEEKDCYPIEESNEFDEQLEEIQP